MISLKSELTRRLLNYFFINPHENLYVNEISRNLNLDKRNLVKKIKELEEEGILKSENRGNLKFYSINKNYSLFKEYKNIISKTVGIEIDLKKIMQEVPGIREAYIYGSYAQGKINAHSDIDLLIIGSHNIIILQRKLNVLQGKINREINALNMDEREFKKRMKTQDPFLSGIFDKKYIKLIP